MVWLADTVRVWTQVEIFGYPREIPQTPRTHIAFSAVSREVVDNFYKTALLSGGTDNGEAGIRSHYHKFYYSAYILDPDGYNIEAVFHSESE